ncbi:MAG: GTP cyclohydrolase I FolE [Actinomycetota bacterium]|nr:GTP cyclohydrolase I FolE [Actinomycetota bacterium]
MRNYDDDGAPGAGSAAAPVGSAAAATGAPVDLERIEAAVREILLAIGEDPDRSGLAETPQRVAKAYAEVFSGLREDPADVLSTTFDIAHEEMVLVKDIPFYSTCEHHLVPFHGSAHVGYIPSLNGRVTGLSKLARLVDVFAKRPQVQERLTTQIVDAMVKHLKPRGAIVVVECEHMCMSMRGVRKPGAKTVTSAVRGLLHEPATRAEAMSLILGR